MFTKVEQREYALRLRAQGYGSYTAMLTRCYCETHSSYPNYGGRGIEVCAQWRGPGGWIQFLQDVGVRPGPDFWIDRIDNNGNYEPGNVRWATRSEQAKNRRPQARENGRFSSFQHHRGAGRKVLSTGSPALKPSEFHDVAGANVP